MKNSLKSLITPRKNDTLLPSYPLRFASMSTHTIPTTPFAFIFYFVKKQKVAFLLFVLTAMAWAVNDSFFPYFLKLLVNKITDFHGTPHEIFSLVSGLLLVIGLFWVFMELLLRTQGILQIYTYPHFRSSIRESVLEHVKTQSYRYFAEHFAGNMSKKISDLPTSSQAITEMVCFNFVTVITGIIVVLILMWNISWVFAGILLLWLCLHLGTTFLLLGKTNALWGKQADKLSVLNGKIVDILTNMSTVRLFARNHYEKNYVKSYQQEEIKAFQKALWVTEITRISLGISGLFLIFSMVSVLLYGYAKGWVSLGDFTQVGMQTFWLLGWVWFISYQLFVFTREMGTIRDALTLIKAQAEITDIPEAKALKVNHGEIVFNNVVFEYRKGRPVFDRLNITIKPGEKVGLVGFSGSGKTTFVNLILRYFDIKSGEILIDGQNIATVKQESLRENISMIPQEPILFHRTLRENIGYGNINAREEDIIEASKNAHCHEFVEQLEEGYDALVGERGIKLSGGQRQRIAIARALLENAPILILDEATASLDSVTEKLIHKGLDNLMQNKTTLVIAHRLSTLNSMDRILVFQDGKIVEEGTQEELLKQNGHFAHLWKMQSHGILVDEEEEEVQREPLE